MAQDSVKPESVYPEPAAAHLREKYNVEKWEHPPNYAEREKYVYGER